MNPGASHLHKLPRRAPAFTVKYSVSPLRSSGRFAICGGWMFKETHQELITEKISHLRFSGPINHPYANVYSVAFKHPFLVSLTVRRVVGAVDGLERLYHLLLSGSGWPLKGNAWFCTYYAVHNSSAWLSMFCTLMSRSSRNDISVLFWHFKSGFLINKSYFN